MCWAAGKEKRDPLHRKYEIEQKVGHLSRTVSLKC